MKHSIWRSILALVLVICMVSPMCTPLAGFAVPVSAADTELVDYDSMSIQEILALEDELTWVFAGDSITHNASFTNGMNSYPEWFEQYLYTLGREDKVINTAWGGATIEDFQYYDNTPSGYGLKDSDETGKGIENMITNYNPDVVFIKLGMNNRGTATDKFITYYKQMLDAIYEQGEINGKIPKLIIITPTPLGGDSLQGKEYFADKINVTGGHNVWRFQMILEDLVPEYNTANGRNMEFVDFMTGFTSEALVVGDDYAGYFFTDGSDGGLHPNQAAQYLMFKILCKDLGLYDESSAIFGFEYEDINGRAHYTDDTYITDYTGFYHSEAAVAAKIGDTEYSSFTDAFNAAVAAGEGTIILCDDVTVGSTFTVPAGVSITVTDDGNARKIIRGDSLTTQMFDISGSLTLSATNADCLSVDGNSVSATKPALMVNAGGVINVTGGVEFAHLVSTGSAGAMNVAGASGNVATANITGATFSGITGTTGGAIYFGNYAVATVQNSLFYGNKATNYGGAFYCENYSVVNAIDSMFLGNSATSNGGAFMLAVDGNNGYGLTLTGCTVAGNTSVYGGGLFAWKESGLTLDGTVFAGNKATGTPAGNDIHFRMNGTDAKEQLTVQTSGTDPVIADIYFQSGCKGKVYVVGTLAAGSDVSYNWDSAAGFNLTFDSAEAAAANKSYVSLADSLAASYELVYSENVATVTAYTAAEVTNVAKVGDTEYATLAEAITAAGTEGTVTLIADATVDATITIAPGSNITITDDGSIRKIIRGSALTGNMFVVTGNDDQDTSYLHDANTFLTLTGSLVLDGASVSASASAIQIGANGQVTMDGITARNFVTSGNAAVATVAGQWMRRARLSMNDVTVENNAGGSSSYGGAIWSNHAFVDCTDSRFTGNTCGNGGVAYCENYTTATYTNTVFAGNTSSNLGGVFLLACDKNTENGYGLTLTDCVMSGNTALQGGAIYAWKETSLTMDGCTILGNTATSEARGNEVHFRMNGTDSKETLILKATNSPLRTSIYTQTGLVGGLFVQGTLAAGSNIVLNWDNATNMNVTYDSADLAAANKPYVHLAESLAAANYLAYSDKVATVTAGSDKTASISAKWSSLVAENNTWVIAGSEQAFGFQSLNAHRSVFRLMDGSVRCWWPYKDNRFVQAQGTVEELLASFDADTGFMAVDQDIDVYMLLPQVNAVYEAGYVHSDELVATYKAAVQAIADKVKAADMTLVLWTPLAAADDTVNEYITAYAEAVREVCAADAVNILLFDANAFMNERMSANAALENNWFAEGADISPLLANDLVRCFWSKAEMCDDALLNQVRDHNLRVGYDKQAHKGSYIADGIAYSVSVSGESVTVDASAILAAYPEITNLHVAILPVAGCGNYNAAIWNDYAAIENGTATFEAPWDNAAITVYGELNGYIYRFKDVTLSVSVASDKTLPVYETDALTDLCVVGAPSFGFDAVTDTYTVELYQYQKYVQLRSEGGENLTVTVNGETVGIGELSQQVEVAGKTATVTVTVTGGAEDKTYTLNLVKPDYPDIIITEVMEDPNYSSGLYEMIEIYNASGKDLNIKDYALGYKIESAYALIADDGSGNPVDGGLTPDRFTGDDHIFHAVSGTGATHTNINYITKNSAHWADAVEPEVISFPADSTMVIWVKQNWQDTKDTESYEDLIQAVKDAAGDTTLVVTIDGVDTPVVPNADLTVMAEDVTADGGQDAFSWETLEKSCTNFYLENSGAQKRFWLFVTKASAERDDNGSITASGDDIISAARWSRIAPIAGWSTALEYNVNRGFALPYGEMAGNAAETKTTFGAIEYWQKPYDLDDTTAPAAQVTVTETGLSIALTDDTDVRYLYLQIDTDGDGIFETEVTRDFVLEAGVKNAGVSADQASITALYEGEVANYRGYVLDGNNNKAEFEKPIEVGKIGDEVYYSLADAIAAANEMESATIVLISNVALDETVTVSGNVTITDDGTARTIIRGTELTGKMFDVTGTLNLIGTGKDLLKIDGNGVEATGQVISIGTGAAFTARNAVLNGLHSGTYNNGALYFNTGSTVSFSNTTISNTVGGVIYAQGAPASGTTYSFDSCVFTGNSAGAAGAVFNSAKNAVFTITGCTFENNAATGHGGVFYVDQSTYTVSGSTFTGNKTTGGHGGAITVSASANSKAYFTDCTFDGNSAAGHGGTVYARNGACTVEITGGSIINSTAGRYGGAIMGEANSIISVKNVAFSGNSAGDPGEDIAVAAASVLTIDGCTMTSEGDNVYVADASSAVPTVKTTESAAVFTMSIGKGSVKVEGALVDGSVITAKWDIVPGAAAVLCDSYPLAQANVSMLNIANEGYAVTIADDSPAITLYNADACLQDVYLASTGADTNAGTSEAPVLTLNKALELVKNGGTIHIVDTYAADASFVWENHNKDVTITGGTLDFSAMGNGIDFYQNDAVTYDNLTLTLGGWNFYYANGHRLQINENVTVTKTDTCLFGGSGYTADANASKAHTVYGTDVTIKSGFWFKLYGGGRLADVDGDIRIYVGGNTNAALTVDDAPSTQLVYGGGFNSNISGDIDLTIADNVKFNYAWGGMETNAAGYAVGGDIRVKLSGGELYSIYGGHRVSNVGGTMDGNITLVITGGTVKQVFGATQNASQKGNVRVELLGGTITRRFFGGCYNECSALGSYTTEYHVSGNIDVYLNEAMNLSWTETSKDNGFFAHSRQKTLFDDEVTVLHYATAQAKTKHQDNLGSQNSVMVIAMGSSTAVADSIVVDIVARIGENVYGTVEAAIAAASELESAQIILLADTEVSSLVIPANVTFDLAGHTLTVTDGFASMGQVINTGAEGGIKAESDVTVSIPNAQGGYMALYDASFEGYRLFAYSLETRSSARAADSVRFGLAIQFADASAYQLLADQGTATGMAVNVKLAWTGNEEGKTFTYGDDLLKQYGALTVGYSESGLDVMLMLTVTGLDTLEEGTELTLTYSVENAKVASAVSADPITA